MRTLVSVALRRPIGVTALFLLALVMSALSWRRLPVELLPPLRLPSLSVWTPYPDAPPARVEQAVTRPVEEAAAGVAGLLHVTGKSQLGGSLVRLDFGWNTNLDLALLEVREQLDRLGPVLPEQAGRPVVLRVDPSAHPLMQIAVGLGRSTGSGMTVGSGEPSVQDLLRTKRIARDVVARRLEQLPGVARVRVTGGHDEIVEVELDTGSLNAHGLDVAAVEAALARENVVLPGGTLRRGGVRHSLEVTGEFARSEDIEAVVVSTGGAPPVRVGDVGRVRAAVADRRGLVRLDGRETLLLLVERQADANSLATAAEVRATLASLQRELPALELSVVLDDSRFIRAAVDGVQVALLLGGVLAILVLLVFLRRPTPILAVALAIPLSLALTLLLFDWLDLSINLISLSGLALGVGMLVDNAIVVVESVARHREQGLSPVQAAEQGAASVAGAVTSSTLTTIAVFLPLAFAQGLAGRLFRDQSLAVVASLTASLLVALTLVPLLVARTHDTPGSGAAAPGDAGRRLLRLYERLLDRALRHGRWMTAGGVALVVLGALLLVRLPREVVPESYQSRLEVHLALPPESDLPLLSESAAALERALLSWPEVGAVLADLGERDEARLELEPRPLFEGDLMVRLRRPLDSGTPLERLREVRQGGRIEVRPARNQLEELLAADDADLLVDLVAEQRERAEELVESLAAALAARPELENVRRAEPPVLPAYRLSFDRDAAYRFGVEPALLGQSLEAATGGRSTTELRRTNEQVPIVVRLPRPVSLDDLLARQVTTRSGLLPLGRFLRFEPVELPSALWRRDQVPVVRLLADTAGDTGLQQALEAVDAAFAAVLPPDVRGAVSGTNEAFRSALRSASASLLLSLLLVFLILAAQFENLVQPLVILATVPLALAGVALLMTVTGQSVNLMSLTGAVVLVGIVVNDAILKVDLINQLRGSEVPLEEAIRRGGALRVRPILMTSVTTVAGLLPLAVGFGTGAELRAPLAIVIIGGLTASTLLTLFVVPVLYRGVARLGGGAR